MQKALTGIVLLFTLCQVHAQTWTPVPPGTIYFNYSGNKVGIGTTSPQRILHISGMGNVEPLIEATDDGYAQLTFQSHGKAWTWSKRPSFEDECFRLFHWDGTQWIGPYISFHPNGSVGIGTTKTADASYKLFVETGIRTRKIVVDQATWPDYVFHPDYSLPSLPSVATYIKANQHLPDMPSADSVAKNGVDLGSNQAQLLKKVEELTLYVIQQQQQQGELKQQLIELRQQNKEMKEQMDLLQKATKNKR